jgi:hypothetical protein
MARRKWSRIKWLKARIELGFIAQLIPSVSEAKGMFKSWLAYVSCKEARRFRFKKLFKSKLIRFLHHSWLKKDRLVKRPLKEGVVSSQYSNIFSLIVSESKRIERMSLSLLQYQYCGQIPKRISYIWLNLGFRSIDSFSFSGGSIISRVFPKYRMGLCKSESLLKLGNELRVDLSGHERIARQLRYGICEVKNPRGIVGSDYGFSRVATAKSFLESRFNKWWRGRKSDIASRLLHIKFLRLCLRLFYSGGTDKKIGPLLEKSRWFRNTYFRLHILYIQISTHGTTPRDLITKLFNYSWLRRWNVALRHWASQMIFTLTQSVHLQNFSSSFEILRNEDVSAFFVAKYMCRKLVQGFTWRDTLNPIIREWLGVVYKTRGGISVIPYDPRRIVANFVLYPTGLLVRLGLVEGEISRSSRFGCNIIRIEKLWVFTKYKAHRFILMSDLQEVFIHLCNLREQHTIYEAWVDPLSTIYNILKAQICILDRSTMPLVDFPSSYLQRISAYSKFRRCFVYKYWNFKIIASHKAKPSEAEVAYGSYNVIKGFKIQLCGRLSRRQRASKYIITAGTVPLSTCTINVDYSYYTVPLRNSSVTIKVWLTRNGPIRGRTLCRSILPRTDLPRQRWRFNAARQEYSKSQYEYRKMVLGR